MSSFHVFGLAGLVVVAVAALRWMARELRYADARWEAEREAAACAAWEAHVEQALAAASPVPDYVPDEWE